MFSKALHRTRGLAATAGIGVQESSTITCGINTHADRSETASHESVRRVTGNTNCRIGFAPGEIEMLESTQNPQLDLWVCGREIAQVGRKVEIGEQFGNGQRETAGQTTILTRKLTLDRRDVPFNPLGALPDIEAGLREGVAGGRPQAGSPSAPPPLP